jgi:hypothetical protein
MDGVLPSYGIKSFHSPNILASAILVCTGYCDGQVRLCVNLTIPRKVQLSDVRIT